MFLWQKPTYRCVVRWFADNSHERAKCVFLCIASSNSSFNSYANSNAACRGPRFPNPALTEFAEVEANDALLLVKILKKKGGLTADLALNNFLAVAKKKGSNLIDKSIPQGPTVVGFEGIEIGSSLDVSLLTVETAPDSMDIQTTQTLLDVMQGKAHLKLPPLPMNFRAGATLTSPRAKSRSDGQGTTWSPFAHLLKTDLKQG